jgi:hypothetical protein
MKYFTTIFFLIFSLSIYAQKKIDKLKTETVQEGMLLYQSEMASWYGTDLFLAKYNNRENIGGYFSYSNNNKPTCIFFSKNENPKVIGTIVFDNDFNIQTADYNLLERELSPEEMEYYILRKEAKEIIEKDTIFKRYENTTFNLVPLIGKEKKVYVLTSYNGPKKMVAYGNDYLIRFDKSYKMKSIYNLHVSYLPVEYGDNNGTTSIGGMHNHRKSSGELISPTDICTTMLYQKLTGWETYYVMSEKYISIWSCKKKELFVMTMEAWQKINDANKDSAASPNTR